MFQKKHYVLALILVIAILVFGIHFLRNMNYEFLMYIAIVFFVFLLIAGTWRRIHYPFACLVALVIWAILHMAGGAFRIDNDNDVLYGLILIPISSDYPILRYDQVVHFWGFGVCTLITWHLLSLRMSATDMKRLSTGIVVIMAGCGFGALNENIEFFLTVLLPQTGVGGYINTSLDLCANFIGAGTAYLLVRLGILPLV